MPILVGLDGQRKMSKSLGNYVGISEAPSDMFGKLMSISDSLMWSYMTLLTDYIVEPLMKDVQSGERNPFDIKIDMGSRIVADFHGKDAAHEAAMEFRNTFRKRQQPTEAPAHTIPRGPAKRVTILLTELGLVPSRSEADRLVKQGGVEIDGERVIDVKMEIDLSEPRQLFLRAGKKKFLRIVVE
jgi:tyrosyl-tRNA synthetase